MRKLLTLFVALGCLLFADFATAFTLTSSAFHEVHSA